MSLRQSLRQLRYFDWVLMAGILVLCAFSLAALYGLAKSFALPDFVNLRKQLFFIALGLAVMLGAGSLSLQRVRQLAPLGYGAGLVMLATVLGFGQTLRGTTGWFTFGTIGFQPVEFAKLFLIAFVAYLVSRQPRDGQRPHWLLASSGAATAVYVAMTLLQPDFGSAMMLVAVWLGMMAITGLTRRQALTILALLIVVGAVGWTVVLKDYQRARILTFLNPAADPYGRGYQVRQAVIAVGSGQWFGRGLGAGSQSQLKFLPAAQTDFIFAVIAEELGFFGATLVLAAYAVILYRLVALAQRAPDDFTAALVYGVSVLLFFQVAVNVGMNLGLMPVTGIGLPFVSYGGSYLVITFALLGLAQGVAASSVKYRV